MKIDHARVMNYIATIILAFLFALFALIFYMIIIEDREPLTIFGPMTVEDKIYYPEDTLWITAEVCRNTDAVATIYESFVNTEDGSLYQIAPRDVNSLPLGCSVARVGTVIPCCLPPGEYYRQTRIVYHVNILVDRTVSTRTETFIVGEKPEE